MTLTSTRSRAVRRSSRLIAVGLVLAAMLLAAARVARPGGVSILGRRSEHGDLRAKLLALRSNDRLGRPQLDGLQPGGRRWGGPGPRTSRSAVARVPGGGGNARFRRNDRRRTLALRVGRHRLVGTAGRLAAASPGRRFPCWLPPLLLALSPAYLLYIRNCRYYSLGVFFSLLVWILWAPGRAPPAGCTEVRWTAAASFVMRRRRRAFPPCLTQYMNAATLLATLPVFFLDRRDRQPRQYVMLGILWCVAIAYGAWLLATGNPLTADYRSADWLFAPPAAAGLVDAVFDELSLVHPRRGHARIHSLGGRCGFRLAAAAVAGDGTDLRGSGRCLHGEPSRASTARAELAARGRSPGNRRRPGGLFPRR